MVDPGVQGCPTCYRQLVRLAGNIEMQPSSPFSVVTPTQIRDSLCTLLVHIHVTCCNTWVSFGRIGEGIDTQYPTLQEEEKHLVLYFSYSFPIT